MLLKKAEVSSSLVQTGSGHLGLIRDAQVAFQISRKGLSDHNGPVNINYRMCEVPRDLFAAATRH